MLLKNLKVVHVNENMLFMIPISLQMLLKNEEFPKKIKIKKNVKF